MRNIGIIGSVILAFAAGIAFVYSCGGGSSTSAATFLELPPVAKARLITQAMEPGFPAGFDGSASFDPNQDVLTYQWDFGDGETSSLMNPDHFYAAEGTYYATLTVVDSTGLMGVDVLEVTVPEQDQVPSATVAAANTIGLAPLRTDFTASTLSGNAPFQYIWDFGDGTTSTLQNPSHVYAYPGTYSALVIVTDANGDTDADTIDITVSDYVEPKIFLKALPLTGSAPLTVDFDSIVLGGSGAISYVWDFGDGSSLSALAAPSHAYSAGEYLVTCIITDDTGMSAGSNLRISVTP